MPPTPPILPKLFTRLTAELQVLVCCARLNVSAPFDHRLGKLLSESLDWGELLGLGQKHGMLALMKRNLKPHFSSCPTDFASQLELLSKSNAAKQILLSAQLPKIDKILKGIPAIHWKGIALDEWLYHGQLLRSCGDLDILIRRSDLTYVREAFEASGYVSRNLPKRKSQIDLVLRREKDITFVHRENGHAVEVHWQLLGREFSPALNYHFFGTRHQTIRANGVDLLTLAPNDQLLTLSLHGAKHGYSSLKWLCDIGELLKKHPEVSWTYAIEKAQELGLCRSILLTIELLEKLYGSDLPDKVLQRVKANPEISKISAQAVDRLNQHESAQTTSVSFLTQLFDTAWGRSRYYLMRGTHISSRDVAMLDLPTTLFPLYYGVHAWRLIREKLRTVTSVDKRNPN